MTYVLTPKQMQEADKKASYDYLIPELLLMEHAAYAVYEELVSDFTIKNRIGIIVGSGNNAGDGMALARLLFQHQYEVFLILLSPREDFTVSTTVQFQMIESLQIPYYSYDNDSHALLQTADCIVDGMLGSGCNRALEGKYFNCVHYLNSLSKPVYAIDIPTGLHGESGNVMGCAVKATKTIVLETYKTGNILGDAKMYSGMMIVKSIGIPKAVYESMEIHQYAINECISAPEISPLTHKGMQGNVLIIAGSEEFGGALLLASEAAYRSGVGIVHGYSSVKNRNSLLTYLPEVIFHAESTDGNISKDLLDTCDSILIGPGMTASELSCQKLQAALSGNLPMVLDADALNLLSMHPKLFHLAISRSAITVFTPHLKEMERLTGLSVLKIKENLLSIARHYAKQWNVILVLKNHRTIIAFPDETCYINLLGNEGMATGGTGDVLSGYLAGLLAGNSDIESAIIYGVARHSMAGDKAKKEKGSLAMLAGDVLKNM